MSATRRSRSPRFQEPDHDSIRGVHTRMTSDRPTPPVKVDEVMREIEDEVRRTRRERLLAQGGARGYADPAIYTAVDAVLRRALDQETLLLPDLISGDDD